jgi:PilZ domain
MHNSDRRLFPRYTLRIPVRYRIADFSTDIAEHTTVAINVSRNGLLLATEALLPLGATLDMALRVPIEISGIHTQEARCKGRIVHEQVIGNGRMGYGVQIERMNSPYIRPEEHSRRVAAGTF